MYTVLVSLHLTCLLLLQEAQSKDPLHQQRSLLVLNHVIKMLASKRLIPDRQLFRQVLKTYELKFNPYGLAQIFYY